MDHRRRKQKKQPNKKKQVGNDAPAQAAIEARLMEEEERLVAMTMELSLKESLMLETEKIDEPEAQEVSLFETELKNCLFAFDSELADLIDPLIDDDDDNHSATSLFHAYLQRLAPGGKEKPFQTKLSTALLIACVLGLPRVVKYLLDRGASASTRVLGGWTPMHFAAALGNVSVLRVLLTVVPVTTMLHDMKDKAEMTPLDILAQELEQTPVKIPLELLKLFGRWRSHLQDSASAPSAIDPILTTNTFDKFNNADDFGDDDDLELAKLESLNDSDDEAEEDVVDPSAMEHPPSQLFAWGSGTVHLQGHGDMSSRSNPKKIKSLEHCDIVSIATSQFMSAAVSRDGQAYIWGLSEGMRLALPSQNAQELSPIQISPSEFGMQPVTMVSLSNYHGAFVDSDGVLYTFGRGREGQLGLGHSLCDPTTLNDPQLPATLSYMSHNKPSTTLSDSGKRPNASVDPKNPFGAAALPVQSSAESHAAMLSPPGGDAYAHSLTRVKLSSKTKPDDPNFIVTRVSCSDSHTVILTQSGHCWTFGNGSKGQLGHDQCRGEHSPRLVRGLGDIRFRHVSAGPTHTVVASQSDVWVFGFGDAVPRRQKFAFGTPARAVKLGLLPSFNICALASGTLHYLILTKEGDLFSWMHGIDKHPIVVNVDMKQLEKTRSQYESSIARSGFSMHTGSSNPSNLSLSGHSATELKSGLDRERHHVVDIACVGTTNYVTTSDGLVFTFSNSQRRSAPFNRVNVLPRIRLLAPGRTHFLASVDLPWPPREGHRPPNPPKLLAQHLQNIWRNQVFTNVIFECQDEVRTGHKFILAISPYLKAQFEASENKNDTYSLKLPESMPVVVLDLVLSFIYFGHFVVPENYPQLDRKKPLGLKPEHFQMLVNLATEWGLTTLIDLITESKTAAQPFTSFPSSTLDSPFTPAAASDSTSNPNLVSYRAWIHEMQDHLATQIENSQFSDSILVVGAEQTQTSETSPSSRGNKAQKSNDELDIPIHRALVVERSEWMKMTLSMSSGWSESQSLKVSMPHLRVSAARLVLAYLYTDSLPNKENTSMERLQELTDLLATADELLLPELKLIVARRMSRMLTPENVAAILDVAVTYGAEDLQNCIVRWIASNVELLLRLGSLADLTNGEMTMIEEVVKYDRGVHPWRYFKSDTEEKVLKLASTLLPQNQTAPSGEKNGAAMISSAPLAEETLSSPESSESVGSTSSSALSASAPGNSSESGTQLTSSAPSASIYVPPSKRRAMEEAQANAKLESSPFASSPTATASSFAQIQKEQLEAESRALSEAQAAKPKNMFTWASPASTAKPAPTTTTPTITNHILTSTSQSIWPSLPATSQKPEPIAQPVEAPSVSVPPAATTATVPIAAPKKQKILPSPLRDPKTLSSKDAVFTPKVSSSPPATASNASSSPLHANKPPSAQAAAKKSSPAKSTSSESTPASKPALSKMSAAVAEYKPSTSYGEATTSNTHTAPTNSGPKKSGAQRPQQGRQAGQPKKNTNTKRTGGGNELGGAMKPANSQKGGKGKGQANHPRQAQAAAAFDQHITGTGAASNLTPDEELAIALSRSEYDSSFVAIQNEEKAMQQHRQKSLLQIQEEERQLEEHRLVEAYYAAKQERKNSDAKQPSSSSNASQSSQGKRGHGGGQK